MQSKGLSRRQLLRVAASLVSSAAIAGCQPRVVEVEKVVKETVVVKEEVEKVVEKERVVQQTVVVEKVQDVTILRCHFRLGAVEQSFGDSIDRFMNEHPSVKVVSEEFPAGSAEYGPKIASLVAGGVAGDTTWVANGSGSWQFLAGKKALAALDELVSVDNTFSLDDYYEFAVDSLRLGPQGVRSGELFALPHRADGTWHFLFFNKSMLEDEGLPVPTNDWSLDDLLNMAIKATRERRFGYLPTTQHYSSMRVHVIAFGGELISDDGKTSLIDSEPVKKAMTWVYDCFHTSKVAPTPQQLTGGRNQMFLGGQLAAFQSGAWDVSVEALAKDSFEVGVVQTPRGPSGERGGHMHIDALAIFADSKNKPLAFELLKYLTDHEADVDNAIEFGASGRPATWDDERVHSAQPNWQIFKNALAESAPLLGAANLRQQEMQTETHAIFEPLWIGDQEPDDAFFADASARFQRFLDKAPE